MPKKRKTKEQKIIAEHRQWAVHETAPSGVSSQNHASQETASQGTTFSLASIKTDKPTSQKSSQTTAVTIATDEYKYLPIDLSKTAIVTGAIVITEIIVRIVFRG